LAIEGSLEPADPDDGAGMTPIADGEVMAPRRAVVDRAKAGEACPSTASVDEGDTLSRIARRCATTLNAILAANPDLRGPGLIWIAQKIRLPSG
jgi:hypothetical protein